jgi:cytochrome P450
MNKPLGSSVIALSPAATGKLVGKSEHIEQASPVRLTGANALRWGVRFARDPLVATRQCFERFGGFVMLSDVVPFVRPRGVAMLGVPLVLTAGAAFHRELLSNPATWRGVSLLPGGPRHSAARRLGAGLTRMTGRRHAHYRSLIAPTLRKSSVDAMIGRMAVLAEAEVASWPVGEPLELWELTRRLMRPLAVELLFGGDPEGYHLADLASELMEGKWSPGAFVPINLPFTPYGRMLRTAERMERHLLEWIASKRGQQDGQDFASQDLASIVINSPDADGTLPSDEAIAGQMPSLIAAASEASHSALAFTLLLVALHPRIAGGLFDELRGRLGGAPPSLEEASHVTSLDGVVKESMRILPPVPLQIRVAQTDAAIAGHPVPKSTRVMLNTFLVNRTPELYPDGDMFRPERWRTATPSAYQYPVFSAGPHACPGYWFGLAAVKVALAAVLSRYRIVLEPGARLDYKVQPTMRPLNLRVMLHAERVDTESDAPQVSGNLFNLLKLPQ